MKKAIIILILFSLLGCKAKKVYVETHSTDTIYKKEIIKITPPQLNELIIDNPCDSLGNLKPFNYSFGTDNNKVSLKSENNTIYLEQNLDSIKQVWLKEQNISVKTSEKVVEVEVIPTWIWKYLTISLIINLLFGIYIFRKFIPILKFIP